MAMRGDICKQRIGQFKGAIPRVVFNLFQVSTAQKGLVLIVIDKFDLTFAVDTKSEAGLRATLLLGGEEGQGSDPKE